MTTTRQERIETAKKLLAALADIVGDGTVTGAFYRRARLNLLAWQLA